MHGLRKRVPPTPQNVGTQTYERGTNERSSEGEKPEGAMRLPRRERETYGQGDTKGAQVACHVFVSPSCLSENECRDALREHDQGNPSESRA
jgi:hypothetical protein